MTTYTFYPADNSPMVKNVEAPTLIPADKFGCIETPEGVYVPTPNIEIKFVSLDPVPGPYTDVFGEYHAE